MWDTWTPKADQANSLQHYCDVVLPIIWDYIILLSDSYNSSLWFGCICCFLVLWSNACFFFIYYTCIYRICRLKVWAFKSNPAMKHCLKVIQPSSVHARTHTHADRVKYRCQQHSDDLQCVPTWQLLPAPSTAKTQHTHPTCWNRDQEKESSPAPRAEPAWADVAWHRQNKVFCSPLR